MLIDYIRGECLIEETFDLQFLDLDDSQVKVDMALKFIKNWSKVESGE